MEDISLLLADQNPWWTTADFRRARSSPYRRTVFSELIRYVGDLGESGRAAVLLGPRQVGKTTLLLQVADELLDKGWPPANLTFFDFSDDRLVRPTSARVVASTRPPGFRDDYPRVLLLDEIQESEAWQRWLKIAVDESRRANANSRSYLLATGSSAKSLRGGGVESGQGRWDELLVEGLTFREFLSLNATRTESETDRVDDVASRDPTLFPRFLLSGGFPEHARNVASVAPLSRIRQDIIERAVLRDLLDSGAEIDRVKRLFVSLVMGSGAIWDAASRTTLLEADRKSVDQWLRLLEDTRLVQRLETDHRPRSSPSGQLRPRKKIYAADHGLITALSSLTNPLADSETRGRVLEATVFRHLREVARTTGSQIGYFRRSDDLEIDFVVRPPNGGAIAIEVTTSARARERKVMRFSDAAALAKAERKLLIYDGILESSRQGVTQVPAHRFLLDPGEYLDGSL